LVISVSPLWSTPPIPLPAEFPVPAMACCSNLATAVLLALSNFFSALMYRREAVSRRPLSSSFSVCSLSTLTTYSFWAAKSLFSLDWRSLISAGGFPRAEFRFVKMVWSLDLISFALAARWIEKSSLPLNCNWVGGKAIHSQHSFFKRYVRD
jgi:hypothetical protein